MQKGYNLSHCRFKSLWAKCLSFILKRIHPAVNHDIPCRDPAHLKIPVHAAGGTTHCRVQHSHSEPDLHSFPASRRLVHPLCRNNCFLVLSVPPPPYNPVSHQSPPLLPAPPMASPQPDSSLICDCNIRRSCHHPIPPPSGERLHSSTNSFFDRFPDGIFLPSHTLPLLPLQIMKLKSFKQA